MSSCGAHYIQEVDVWTLLSIIVGQSLGFFGAYWILRFFSSDLPRLTSTWQSGIAWILFWALPTVFVVAAEIAFRYWSTKPGLMTGFQVLFPSLLSGVLALMLSMLGSWVSEKHWCQETLSKDIASATVLFLVFFNLFVSVALIRFWPLRAHAWS